MRMSTTDIEALRRQIAQLLPAAMARCVASYRSFALGDCDEPEGAPDFGRHHAACRAALNHLDALTRLARWASADAGTAAAFDETELAGMAKAARAALSIHRQHPEDGP